MKPSKSAKQAALEAEAGQWVQFDKKLAREEGLGSARRQGQAHPQ